MLRRCLIVALAVALQSVALADGPVTSLRSARNGVSLQVAPASVSQGGVLAVFGTALADGYTAAEGVPLPTALGNPSVEVLVNGLAAPLYFVSPDQVNAQVPWEVAAGRAEVVLRRDGADSPPMPLEVLDARPELFTRNGSRSLIAQAADGAAGLAPKSAAGPMPLALSGPSSGGFATGEAQDADATVSPGRSLTVFAAGGGQTEPAAVTGAPARADSAPAPTAPQRAYLGGIPVADLSVRPSAALVGVYEVTFQVPDRTESGEVFRWYSGDRSAAGLLGASGEPAPQYMAVPERSDPVQRIDMTDLNPYFVAVSGALNEAESCYPGVHLLDFRRGAAEALPHCVLPSNPLAEAAAQRRPFEPALHSPHLAALAKSSGAAGRTAITDLLILVNGVTGAVSTVDVPSGADRLQPGLAGSRSVRLLRPGGGGDYTLVDPGSGATSSFDGNAPLPDPLAVDGLGVEVAQGAALGNGYRMRFLASEPDTEPRRFVAALFDRDARVAATADLPDGWDALSPPRRIDNQGEPAGGSLAPVIAGFDGDATAYLVARASDGTRDAVVAFHAVGADAPEALPTASSIQVTVTPFPPGSFAANCTPQVRWQPMDLTRRFAMAATGRAVKEFARPQANEICVADRLVIFDPTGSAVKQIPAPKPLDAVAKGALSDFLYFGDGGREVALEAPRAIHVFDGVAESFREIGLPSGTGITINPTHQQIAGQARIVAPATSGPPRTNPNTGALQPPLAGNRGMVVVDLPAGTATLLALPPGFTRLVPGNAQMARQGRRAYGVAPLADRAFGRARRPNAGPGNPGGSAMLTWDVASGAAAELPLPDGGYSVVQPVGPGSADTPFVWDFNARSASFAYGVYDRDGALISIGVVAP